MFDPRAARRKKLSPPRIGTGSQARVRWGRRSEHWWHGRVQSGGQLERAPSVQARKGSDETAASRLGEGKDYLSRTSVSGADDHQRRRARARIQLPLWRSGDAGAFATNEIRSVAIIGSNDRRQDRQMRDRLGQTRFGDRRARFGRLSGQIRNWESDLGPGRSGKA